MSRSQLVLDLLEAWLNAGSRVLNSPLGVRVVLNRPALFSLLARHGLNVPRWGWQYTTDAPEDGWMKKNAWASHNGFPHNGSRADRRGTNGQKWMLLQEMVDHRHATKLYSIGGDLVLPTGVSLDLEQTRRARRLVSKCREVTGVEIFGLDVLWHDGHAVIVDVNDFPSFAGVHEASESIAEFAVRSLRARQRI